MNIKNSKGITLVALVVTIVVLLILAGVSINLVLGENGLITQAQEAKRKTAEAEKNETESIDSIEKIINDETSEKIEDVIIPKGYYYVGGTKSKGIVISDDENDKEKYKDIENVPSSGLIGNQWVWVPVENVDKLINKVKDAVLLCGTSGAKTNTYTRSEILNNKKRIEPGNKNGYREPDILTNIDNDENAKSAGFNNLNDMAITMAEEYEEMINSLRKYNGFYIGRYELSVNGEKAGATVNKNWYELYNKCKNVGKNSSVKTRMLWGINWDILCVWIENNGFNINNSSEWGNYKTKAVDNGIQQYTGTNEKWKSNNIYDLAGNCWEWTQETGGDTYRVYRGGGYRNDGITYNVACTSITIDPSAVGYTDAGTRPILYLVP